MESTDIFSLAVAAVIALATMGMQPWTPQWWLAITVASAIAVGAGLHILWKNLSKAEKEILGPYIWAPDGKVRGWIGIALLCVVMGTGYELLSRMTPRVHDVPVPKERPIEAPAATATAAPAPTLPLRSIMGDVIYACEVPPPSGAGLGTTLFAQQLDYFSKNLKLYGDSIGAKFSVSPIDGGIRIDVDALTDGPRAPITGPFHKGVIEIRRVGNFEMVNIKIEMPDILKLLPVNPEMPEIVTWTNNITHLLSIKDGACRLI
jgi:hypothetical protein